MMKARRDAHTTTAEHFLIELGDLAELGDLGGVRDTAIRSSRLGLTAAAGDNAIFSA
jgi:hypothetical protein